MEPIVRLVPSKTAKVENTYYNRTKEPHHLQKALHKLRNLPERMLWSFFVLGYLLLEHFVFGCLGLRLHTLR